MDAPRLPVYAQTLGLADCLVEALINIFRRFYVSLFQPPRCSAADWSPLVPTENFHRRAKIRQIGHFVSIEVKYNLFSEDVQQFVILRCVFCLAQMDEYPMSEFVSEGLARENLELLHLFYQTGELCDVDITVSSGRVFSCHRLVLACVSHYFRAMFKSKMVEATEKSITIQDIEEEAMEKLILFAYTSRIKLSTENVQSLLYAASILQIETVANACSSFMQSHLDPSNCIEVRNFAQQHNRIELIKTTDSYIRDNFIAVSLTEEFLLMTFDILLELISSQDLNVESEEQVYAAIIQWIGHNPEDRKNHLPRLLEKVRLPLLSPAFLINSVERDELIRNSLECQDYVSEAKNYQMSLDDLVPEVNITERSRPRKSYAGIFSCAHCSQSFHQSWFLQRHMKYRHQNKHLELNYNKLHPDLDLLELDVTNFSGVQTHKRKHTGEKPYKCDVCNFGFTLSGDLKRHKRIHTGEKPYKCDVCNFGFSLNGNLKRHKRIHTVEKP